MAETRRIAIIDKDGANKLVSIAASTSDPTKNGLVILNPDGSNVGGGHVIQDEGVGLTQRANLNFIGGGVVATDNAVTGATDVTITGFGTGDVTTSDTLTDDTIILGANTTVVKTSAKTIATTLGADDTTVPTSKAVKDVTDGKQATLVSGTNIKTINSGTILGAGDIALLTAANIDDTAYGVGRDSDTTHAPTKNALYDKFETLAGASLLYNEVPGGAINGVNVTFTITQTPASGGLYLYRNGLLQNEGAGNDYTLSGTTITMVVAPLTGDVLIARIVKSISAAGEDGFGVSLDGQGGVITTGIKGDWVAPYDCTITGRTLLADQAGSMVVDAWKDTYANYPPTVADTIRGGAKPTLIAVNKNQATGLAIAVTAGNIIRFNVDSCTTCTRATLSINTQK